MSVSSDAPLAPAWLTVPSDANALATEVWPASAGRDADGAITIGGIGALELRDRFGTPLYVVDEDEVRERARRVRAAFESAARRHDAEAIVYYAGKAFLTVEFARWIAAEGLRIDVCSRGELEVALVAGVDAALLGYHGNNKTSTELERAVDAGVGTIVVDSEIEIERLSAIASRRDAVQRVLVRVRTGVHAETHAFLATAHEDQKFGFAMEDVPAAVARIRELPGLRFTGLHAHIGSQIFGTTGFRESAGRLVDLHAELLAGGDVPVLNVGGGFGIAYTAADDPSPIEEIADGIFEAIAAECVVRGIPMPSVALEPGRTIVGRAGITLYEVGTVKRVEVGEDLTRTYVAVDGGMSDNARFALYGADFSARIASRESDAEPALARVVGLHCESGDIVVDAEYLPADVAPGDLIAVPATGAYCFSLASTYNYTPRPPVIAVRDGDARVLVRRESIADLLSRDLAAPASEPNEQGKACDVPSETKCGVLSERSETK